jgi:BirA family biotin operon repressor/biotin-[acetyl-CoA-carboxylase] ligase
MVTGMSGADANGAGAAARARLRGTKFADVRWTAETGSTNADAMELARHGEREGVVLVADHQTAGRGRRGRSWEAPEGASLLFTVLLRPPAAVAGLATMALGVAAAEALEALGYPGVRLKWPNDLVVSASPGEPGADRKLAGILAEADWPAGSSISDGWRAPTGSERVPVVIGMGLNVRWPLPGDPAFPTELAGSAVALNHLGRDVDRPELLAEILRRLDDVYRALVSDGPEALLAAWRGHSATLGRRVRVDLGADDLVGTAVDLSPEGHLVVETIDGDRRTVAVGDVVHLRPA